MTGDTFEKVKKGVKDTAEEVKETAEKITDPDTYTGSAQEKEIKENRFTVSITAGIAVVLLLIGGTGTNTILFNTGYAQTATLGAPIFVEKGGDTIKRELAPTQHNTLLLLMER
jgi:hypothetical protein